MGTNKAFQTLTAISLLAYSATALAQRTDDNAATQAEDAFGSVVGDSGIGLYGPDDVRGFSAGDAGNIRLNGLYIDRQGGFTAHLIRGFTIHVGPSAQGYPFPAPTGIADFALREPGDTFLISPNLAYGPYGGGEAELDGQMPLTGSLGLVAGVGIYRLRYSGGNRNRSWSGATLLRWRPSPKIEIVPFFGTIHWDTQMARLIYVTGTELPPIITGTEFQGQPWVWSRGRETNAGVIASARPGKSTSIRFGLFRSVFDFPRSFGEFFVGTDGQGLGDHLVVASPGQKFASWSGELLVTHEIPEGPRKHSLILSVKGRRLGRIYGGADLVDIGSDDIRAPIRIDEPDFSFGASSRDRVRQLTLGAAYNLNWSAVGTFDVGVQKVAYRKAVDGADGISSRRKDEPLLFNAAARVRLSKDWSVYASFTKGFEEGGAAPASAVNRNEAAPSLKTRQVDGGIQFRLPGDLRAVVGVFDITKPYYGVDDQRLFRQLGNLRNRGVEMSLTGQPVKGLTAVVGAVFKDPKVTARIGGEEIVSRPLGSSPRTVTVTLDYRFPRFQQLSIDGSITNTGPGAVRADGALKTPSQTRLDLGARYRMKIAGSPATLRVYVGNVLGSTGWNVDTSGGLWPIPPRAFNLSLAADIGGKKKAE